MKRWLLCAQVGCAATPSVGTGVVSGGSGVSSSSSVSVTADTEPSPTSNATVRVVSVDVSGAPGNTTFSVGLRSDETGCEQYADWWEIIDENDVLRFRRILNHSHVDEQPFVRSGGPVDVSETETIWVRGHMHPHGYGRVAMRGSVADGFTAVTLAEDVAAAVENEPPQPEGCLF